MGGLGIQTFIVINKARQTKLGWQLATHAEKLWVKVLKAEYYLNTTFFNFTCKSSSSWSWKRIFATKSVVSRGAYF